MKHIFFVLVFEDATTSAVPSTAMIASTTGAPACQVLLWETELSPSLLLLLPPLLYRLLSQEADPNADFVLGVLVKLGSKCSHLLSLVLQSLKRGVHFCFFHLSGRKNHKPSIMVWAIFLSRSNPFLVQSQLSLKIIDSSKYFVSVVQPQVAETNTGLSCS